MALFQHNISDRLLLAQKDDVLTDFETFFQEHRVSCHKAIVSPFCQRLNLLIQKRFDYYDVGEVDDATFQDLELIVQSYYGQPLSITGENALSFYLLSKILSDSNLEVHCKLVLKKGTTFMYTIDIDTILNNLRCDEFKDHQIIFHDFSLKIHKFFFASISPYFKAKFTKQWLDSNDTTSDFSKLLQVSPSSFSNFFTSFYDGNLKVNFENAFEYSHLAWYFQLSELEKFVEDFILNSKAEYQWVTSLVLKAINCEDYRFIKIISTKISEIPDLSSCDPIPVHPLFFQNLTSIIDVSWLLRCLVFSYTNYSEDNVWTPQSLEKSFETIKFDSLAFDEIYQSMEPLFSISDLFDCLSSFSLSIFCKFTSEVPLNWFTWFIVESDFRKEFNLISQVSPLLNEIITPENIDQVPVTAFHSETLLLFAINFKQGTSIYWSLLCLIELWSRSQLNVEEFSRILMGLDLSATRFDLVHCTLSRLFSDEILKPILFDFVTLKLISRLMEENQANISKLEQKNLQQQMFIHNLQDQLKEKDLAILEYREKEQKASKDAELKRQAEEERRLEELKRLAELERTRTKFLASNKGSNITLSENDLGATRVITDSWDNGFVAIQHPTSGQVVLILYNFQRDFNTSIGFFRPSESQTRDCIMSASALYVYSGFTQFYLNGSQSGPHCGVLSRGQQVVIEFNNDQATFSVPSLGYSHTVTWPSGYVFGLAMSDRNTSWKLSSN
ncbi:hypothetical protein RCL1_008204 [Eukaryota sp. TZLM3-RCL]